MDKDIITLQTETDLAKRVRAIKNLSRKTRYEIKRCPTCGEISIRDLLTGKEITIENDDALNEFIQLPIGDEAQAISRPDW
jgi:aromatic ring hydroxylase